MISANEAVEYRNKNGMTTKEAAEHFCVPFKTFEKWVTQYNKGEKINTRRKSVDELLKQRERIEKQIQDAIRYEREEALFDVRDKIKQYSFTVEEIGIQTRIEIIKKQVPPKYADMIGNTWSGRGKEPYWIKGKDRSMYLVSNCEVQQ